ncbi:MAG: AAA family ATPase [Chloroflexi bacterium]|nr:AAA family ATPase [Chloroflexota bacterium]
MTSSAAPTDHALRLFLLGGFRAERDGAPIPASAWLRRAAARTLVKLLAARADHRIHREEAVELLWPDVELDAALNRFGKALHAARRALEPDRTAGSESSYLHLLDDVLVLDATRVWIDVDHFESLAHHALPSGDLFALETAVAGYSGELLPEDRYEDWATPRRHALAELYTRTLLRRAALLEQQGACERAAEDLRHIVTADPLQEEAHRALMRLYALAGQRSQALRQYRVCRQALQEEVGTEPEQETEELHRAILNERALWEQPPAVHASRDPALLPASIRQPPATPTLGRSRVFDILRADLVSAAQGSGSVVLVSGEEGVGKTRLVADLGREAWQRGMGVLWGAAHGHTHCAPYGPFVEALEGYLVTAEAGKRDDVAARYPLLALLFPSLDGHHPGSAVDIAPEMVRARLFASFAALLAHLSQTRPLLLVLDNLQVADEASLGLLQYLARAASDHRWLVVGTYREEELVAGSMGPSVLTSLPREELARHIALGRLARRDVDQLVYNLLPAAPDPALLHRVHALSLGNPLFVHELLRAEGEREGREGTESLGGAPPTTAGSSPRGVRQLVAARLARLGPDVRRVLTLAACLGVEWTYDDLQAAARTAFPTWFSPEALLEALDRALDAQIIEDGVQRFSFRHPLFHTALVDETASHWRSHLHAAVGATIELRRPASVHELAFHYSRSHDREKAILYLEKAGDSAWSVRSYHLAADHFRELAVALEQAGRWAELAIAREKLGVVLSLTARYDEAVQELHAAIERFRSVGDLEAMGRTASHLGRLHFRRGTPSLGLASIQPTLDEIERVSALAGRERPQREGTGSAPGLYAVQALLQGACGNYGEHRAVAERACEMARLANDRRVLALAEYARAAAYLALEEFTAARHVLESVAPLAESVSDLDVLSRAHADLAFIDLVDGSRDDSQRHLDLALESAEQLGDPVCLAFIRYRLGVSAYLIGDTGEAHRRFEQAAETNDHTVRSWIAPYVLTGFALLRALTHDKAEALDCLLRSREAAERVGDPVALTAPYRIPQVQQRLRLGSESGRARVIGVFRQAGELLGHRIVA